MSRRRRTSRRDEFEVFLEMPASLDFCVVATDVVDRRSGAAFRGALGSRSGYIFTHSSETLLLNPNAPQMFDDKGNGLFSTVLLDWIEWEGPLVSEAEKSRRKDVVPPDDATAEVVAEQGGDLEEMLIARSAELDRADELDLVFDTNPAAVSAAGLTQARPVGSVLPQDPAAAVDTLDSIDPAETDGANP
jgi:hypothetical protein